MVPARALDGWVSSGRRRARPGPPTTQGRMVRRLHAESSRGGVDRIDQKECLGLTGAEASLPAWTTFMKAATASRPETEFAVPPGVVGARSIR